MKNSIENTIIGAWELESFIIENLEKRIEPWGNKAHGMLIYSESGHMSVSINKEISFQSENEFENIFDSLLFYSGTYQFEGNIIRHRVTQASNPNRIGKELIRFVEWDQDRIRLTTPEESFGRGILVWKRIK